nr:iron ABC transporter permease [Ardenticatena sp.]
MAHSSNPRLQRRTRGGRVHRPPPLRVSTALMLWVPSLTASLLVLLPLTYLALRVFSGGFAAWRLVFRPSTLEVIWNSGLLAAAVTVCSALIALPLAWLTVRTDLPGRRTWTVLVSLPLVIPSYVGAYLFIAALGPRGMVQQWLESTIGITRLPTIYGFPGALIVLTLMTYPYMYLSIRAALQGLDPSLEEAARSLGHTGWATFRRVTLPQLQPALAAGGLLVALYTLRDFGAVSLMRYNTFTRVIYVQYKSSFDRTSAAALALVLVVLTLVLLVIEARIRGRARYHRAAVGAARRAKVVRLGRWRWPALAFCASIVLLALVLPAAVLLYWLVRGWLAGEEFVSLWGPLRNSLSVSAIAALVTTAFALPIAFVEVRWPSHLSRFVERATYIGYALPGIVIALALVFFGVRFARPIYQTIWLLILAYVVLFLPQAVGAIRSSLLQVNPAVEEAARSLGRKPWEVLVYITLPLVRPGLVAAFGLVFLTTMKELPATLILGPFDFKTLATVVWGAVSEAFFARAAAPALLIILASSLPMAFFVVREETHE